MCRAYLEPDWEAFTHPPFSTTIKFDIGSGRPCMAGMRLSDYVMNADSGQITHTCVVTAEDPWSGVFLRPATLSWGQFRPYGFLVTLKELLSKHCGEQIANSCPVQANPPTPTCITSRYYLDSLRMRDW